MRLPFLPVQSLREEQTDPARRAWILTAARWLLSQTGRMARTVPWSTWGGWKPETRQPGQFDSASSKVIADQNTVLIILYYTTM